MGEFSTDSSILARAKSGDPDAWNALVRWAGGLVFFWCKRAGLKKEDREDIFQDVFVKVRRGLANFKHGMPGQSFRAWLLVITRNTIVDLVRLRLAEPERLGDVEYHAVLLASDQLSDEGAEAESIKDLEFRHALEVIRSEFSENSWAAFWRTAVDGLEASAVAGELSMSAGAVRKAKSRVLSRLRNEFDGLIDSSE